MVGVILLNLPKTVTTLGSYPGAGFLKVDEDYAVLILPRRSAITISKAFARDCCLLALETVSSFY